MLLLLVLAWVPGLSMGTMLEMLSFLAVDGKTMNTLPPRERLAARTKSDLPLQPEPSTRLSALAFLSNPPPKRRKRNSQHQRRKTRQPPDFGQHAGNIAAAQQHIVQISRPPFMDE